MREATLLRAAFGVEKTVIEDVEFDPDAGVIVASVRPVARQRGRCGRCRRRCRGYDQGRGSRRRWRSLDLGTVQAWLEAESPRVKCSEHGVVVAHVPWARHGAGHTHAFDQQVAWLATRTSKSAVVELMRVAWRTVGAIIARVWADVEALVDPLEGLTRIGIDEISYRRGHLYLTVVVDHDSGRLVWAAPGKSMATLQVFFDQLGPQRCARVTHVTADGANWINNAVTKNCPDAVLTADPFHVVKWANDAMEVVRRESWREARRAGATKSAGRSMGYRRNASTGAARRLRRSRLALLKNPENLTERQQAKLAWITVTDPRLHRAYLLKEGLRLVFRLPLDEAVHALDKWLAWARRCRIEPFVELARSVRRHRARILAAIEHGLSNGLIEAVNTKIRLITRIAFGFKSPEAIIALAMLSLGGHPPRLPGRT